MSDGAPLKPYHLILEQRPGYLYAYVEGEHDSYEISKAYWQEIAGEVVRLGAKRVLIDENIAESVPLADIYQLASELPAMGFDSARVAFVDRYLDHHEVNSFAELVAVNRGMRGKVFNDLETAERWLLNV
jgi:hypothetical protein